ncbi:MAG TPA: tetratricopeptide repeat protein [Pyrinomonadaceae bacterium]|nr:tetratricopeptide repeat protein [Pyrinomonadaceae bacterium]
MLYDESYEMRINPSAVHSHVTGDEGREATARSERGARLSSRGRAFACALACGLLLASFAPASAQRRATQQRRPATTAQQTQTPSPAAQQEFEQIAAQAAAARDGDRVDEAIGLYKRGLALRPDWTEGWWYLATLYYDADNYSEAARAFSVAARQQPKAGSPVAMLGLCEFQLGRYDDALTHIEQGRSIGVGDNPELTRVMRYHEGLLSILRGEFERAQQTLGTLAFEGLKTDDLIVALGLAALRRGMLPREVNNTYPDRDLIHRVGLAEHFAAQKDIADAQREYELLARDYAKTPDVQYAYGRFLLANRDDDGALAAFQREIENYPKHALARIQIAYIKLKNRDPQAGLPFAEDAAKLYPRLPLSHFVLGRMFLETGQNARAVEELELAQRMAPEYPQIYFQLSRAYAKANRKADAERARDTFLQLNKKAEQADAQQPHADGMTAGDDSSQGDAAAPNKP